jgi:hypothetical protein
MSALIEGGAGGVAHGDLLCALAEAALGDDALALTDAREAVRGVLGDEGVIDCCAIIATFQRMDRIADATGIPLDTATEMASRDLRSEIGIDRFGGAENSPEPGLLQRLGADLLRPLQVSGMRWMARLQKRRSKD